MMMICYSNSTTAMVLDVGERFVGCDESLLLFVFYYKKLCSKLLYESHESISDRIYD